MSSYMLESQYDRQRPPPFNDILAPSSLPSTSMAMPKTYNQPPPPELPTPAQLHQHHPQQPPQIISTPPSSNQLAAYGTTSSQVVLPKIGETRCYWALLTSDLQFIYLDPVLCYHLGEQQEVLVGKSLLSFVHPDEQASAKRDLGGVLENRILHGSVTRVRFARLSSVRRQLGYQGPPPDWAEAEKIVHDETYMAVDLVINWAADGLVLCFLHASVDINAIADNDERRKTSWTNCCGTPWMPQHQIETLYRRLLVCAPQTGSMSRVFQILANERERPLLLSWPPDSAHGPNSRDFAKLVANVQISAGVPGGSDAKTSCTRRYKASQDMPAVFGCQVESIFIPHGTIIFACHKVNHSPPRTSTASTAATTMNQVEYSTAHYVGPHSSSYYDHGSTYSLPHVASHDNSFTSHFATQSHSASASSYPSQRWSQASLTSSMPSSRLVDSYPIPSPSHASAQPSWSNNAPSPNYTDNGPSPTFDRSASPNYTTYSSTSGSSATPSTADLVPPPRRRISPTAARDQVGPIRSSSNRPSGVLRCSSCKTTSSPEWRKGPTGKKELCNACGLRYARSRAKKEGHAPSQSRRRKTDKSAAPAAVDPVKRDSSTPPSVPPYSATRRGYAAASAASQTNETYSNQSMNQDLGNHTPSPSPPSSAPGFTQYTGHDNRPYYATTSSVYYSSSAPSPLSHVHTAPTTESSQLRHHSSPNLNQEPPTPHSASNSHTPLYQQLPPLQRLSSYANKVSSPTPANTSNYSPQSTSSVPSAIASYERGDRHSTGLVDREPILPPTPLSAEPRNAYRRTLLTTQQ